jgi:hypothetical protein
MVKKGRNNLRHRWVESLSVFGVNKVRVYNKHFIKTDKVLQRILSLDKNKVSPYSECLITYMGFWFNPLGLFFRDLNDKLFHCHEFKKRKLIYYVAESFEKNLKFFKFGMPIILVEGALDTEACSYFTKYPYVIGYFTSYVGFVLAALLATLTDSFLVIPDNDQTDEIEKCTRKTIMNFNKFGINPEIISTESKDFGEILFNRNKTDVNKVIFNLNKMRGAV